MNEHKVIGYVSIDRARGHVFCDEDACVIAGSENLMESYLKASGIEPLGAIKKTRYGEIKKGIALGGVYLFDKESWSRFVTIAEKEKCADFKTTFDEVLENRFGGKMVMVCKNV